MNKKTLVIGASTNPERYSNKAVKALLSHNHKVVALGIKDGDIENIPIQKGFPEFEGVHTVTLYLGKQRQPEYYDYIINLQPKRVIFNPGAENPEFAEKLEQNNIEAMEACTLVLLASNQF